MAAKIRALDSGKSELTLKVGVRKRKQEKWRERRSETERVLEDKKQPRRKAANPAQTCKQSKYGWQCCLAIVEHRR